MTFSVTLSMTRYVDSHLFELYVGLFSLLACVWPLAMALLFIAVGSTVGALRGRFNPDASTGKIWPGFQAGSDCANAAYCREKFSPLAAAIAPNQTAETADSTATVRFA